MMDISDTLAPNSDQLDACDLATGPRVFTIESVSRGNVEQPVQVHLAEFPRVWRPSKGMRRVLASCWGIDASVWVGRRVELYCDPSVIFGKEAVGGTRIAKLSHIDREQKIPLLISRGKSAVYTVRPLESADAGREPAPARDHQGEGGHRVSAGESPASANRGAAVDDAAASPEPNALMVAINKQVKAMQSAGQSAHLTTWAQFHGINPTSKALAEKFGDAALDLSALMAAYPMDVPT